MTRTGEKKKFEREPGIRHKNGNLWRGGAAGRILVLHTCARQKKGMRSEGWEAKRPPKGPNNAHLHNHAAIGILGNSSSQKKRGGLHGPEGPKRAKSTRGHPRNNVKSRTQMPDWSFSKQSKPPGKVSK